MKYAVEVMPRPEALDPQGRAVQSVLQRMGMTVQNVRVGKVVVIEVAESDPAKSLELVKSAAEKLLANPLIETYQVRPL